MDRNKKRKRQNSQVDLVSQHAYVTEPKFSNSTSNERSDWIHLQMKDFEIQIRSLKQQLSESQSLIYQLQQQLSKSTSASIVHTRSRIEEYKRTKGKILTAEERRAALHCYQVCAKEKASGSYVTTTDPFLRSAAYLGISQNTIRNVVFGKNMEDRRGRRSRSSGIWHMESLSSSLQQRVIELNSTGRAVTLKRLHRYIAESLPHGLHTPSIETIRKLMHRMGFKYRNVDKTKNFIDTPNIKAKRRYYLQQRYSPEYRDAIFVWLDESYCNQHHVTNKSWYIPGMMVLRKNKGRRYVIVHAGGASGWIGDPLVFEANSSSGDYHSNMNAEIFEEYLEKLCHHCHENGHAKVVFCMDNAKYHRREYYGPNTSKDMCRKTLSQLNKLELIQRLVRLGMDEYALQNYKKTELYKLAKQPEYRAPLAVEEITRRYGYHVLWIPPYHPDLNPTEEAWGITKNYVAYENDGKCFLKVKRLIFEGFKQAEQSWSKLVNRTYRNEMNYIHLDEIAGLPNMANNSDLEHSK